MGLDAKLKNTRTGEMLYIDREYNIKNIILDSYKVEDHISKFGVPMYLMKDIVLDMEGMSRQAGEKRSLYGNILDWLNAFEPHDYIKLVNENQDEYFETED